MSRLSAEECYSTEAPVCPHCEYKHEHDGGFFYDEGLTEYECESCGKMFDVLIYTSTSWTTSIPENHTHDRP